LPGEDGARLTPYVGFDNVVDPTALLAADDGENRIGTTPSSGTTGDTGSGTDGTETGTGDESFQPDANPPIPTTVPEGTDSTDSTDGGEGEGN
ncbi:MAG: hypothetical protein OEW83_08905, partial [Acidimicrobiia bacterium]|nr:hypothetical protein [Acidimicrobiia bacterium]